MRLYFSRHGQFRGYSMGLGTWLVAGVIILAAILALARTLILLAPLIALWALAIWLVRGEVRRWKARRGTGPRS